MQAAGRLNAFLDELDRANLADLEVLVLPAPEPVLRSALLARVDAAAEAGPGRDRVDVEAIRAEFRDLMLARLSSLAYQPTWAGLNWTASPMRMADRARLIEAIADAAVAAALEDRLDPDDVAALREGIEIVRSMPGTAATGVPDLTGKRAAAAPLTAVALTGGTAGLGFVAALAAILRRRRGRLEDRD